MPALSSAFAWVRPRDLAASLLAVLLLVSTGVTLLACFRALPLPEQLDEGEPLIYGLAGRILENRPLYQSIDQQPFVQVHYTPVYYYAVAVLRLFASGFTPGRVLTLACGIIAAGLTAYLTFALSRAWRMGAFAALMFLGLGFPGGPAPFLALVRVDVMGVALSLAAIAVLTHGTSGRHLIAAGGFAGLALLTKQSLFAATVAGTLWLLTVSPRKSAAFAAAAAATVLVPSLLLQWTSGGAYWANIGPDNPTPTSLLYGEGFLRTLLVTQGVPAAMAVFYVFRTAAWRTARARLLLFYWLASSVSIAGVVKAGANHNYWIEFAAANAALATLAVWTCLLPRRKPHVVSRIVSMLPVFLLAAGLGVLVPARLITDRSFDPIPLSWSLTLQPFDQLAFRASGFTNLVNAVRKEPGVVLADGVDVAVLSGHPVAFEPFAFSMLEEQHRWDAGPLIEDICAGRISLLVLAYPIDTDSYPVGFKEFPMWPRSVMNALRHSMHLVDERDWHWLYRPADSIDATQIAACESAARAAST